MKPTALDIAAAVRGRRVSATRVVTSALDRIEALDGRLNCFSAVLAEQALAAAGEIDRRAAQGEDPGPLAGVPFGVKSLYDVAGVTTTAGSRILRDHAPAAADAALVARLKESGAILVGIQVMDEFAYGFTTENAHDGATHNPHDLQRVAGGSSGGSAAAVAAGMVPISLASDTNGSIRVPASFCGVFGLKPTFGRLPRTGSYPFVHDLDHLGPLAGSVADLAMAYDVMQGHDAGDHGCAARPSDPAFSQLVESLNGLRVGVLGGWFRDSAGPQALAAVDWVADALDASRGVILPEVERARAAAFCLTAAAGANLHLDHLRTRLADFDPATRYRFLAGALLPAAVLQQAQRFRQWFRLQVAKTFEQFDILVAPATPCPAPTAGQPWIRLGSLGEVPVRPNMGIYTQPLSFIGLPVVAVPVQTPGELPIGVQIVARPWAEALALRVAAFLEDQGVVAAPVAALP
jgi:AtzE family amidohydrolase